MILKSQDIVVKLELNPFEIKSIKKGEVEILYQQENSWKKTWPILFPICGNLKSQLTLDGQKLELERHGFINKINTWKIIEQAEDKVIIEFNSENELSHLLPFKYKIQISLKLTKNKFLFDFEVFNLDNKDIYYSFGHHPAFIFDNKSLIQLEKQEFFISNFISGLVADEQEKVTKIKEIKKGDLDHTKGKSYFTYKVNSKYLVLKREQISFKVIWPNYDVFILWSQDNEANFICIEPWHGSPDWEGQISTELKDKKDIIKLEKNSSKKSLFEIEF